MILELVLKWMNAFDLTTFFLKQKNFSNNCGNQHGFGMPGRYPSFTNWLLPTHSKLLFVRNLSNDLFFEVKNFQPFIHSIRTYMRAPFFSLDQKYRSKAKSSLHSFSKVGTPPSSLSQMLPTLLPSRRLRIN